MLNLWGWFVYHPYQFRERENYSKFHIYFSFFQKVVFAVKKSPSKGEEKEDLISPINSAHSFSSQQQKHAKTFKPQKWIQKNQLTNPPIYFLLTNKLILHLHFHFHPQRCHQLKLARYDYDNDYFCALTLSLDWQVFLHHHDPSFVSQISYLILNTISIMSAQSSNTCRRKMPPRSN